MITDREREAQRKELGERLRLARKAAGLSQIDLAEAMGDVSRAFVSLVEKGKSGVDNAKIVAAAKALNADEQWLVFGKGKSPKLRPSKDTRRALRPANFTRITAWSNKLDKPPFDDAIPMMEVKAGITSEATNGGTEQVLSRVSDWWRIPTAALQKLDATTDGRNLRIFEMGTSAHSEEVPRGSFALVDASKTELEDGSMFAIDNGLSIVLKRVFSQVGNDANVGLVDGPGQQVVPKRRVKVCGKVVAVFSTL